MALGLLFWGSWYFVTSSKIDRGELAPLDHRLRPAPEFLMGQEYKGAEQAASHQQTKHDYSNDEFE